jgi:hypothetical protein
MDTRFKAKTPCPVVTAIQKALGVCLDGSSLAQSSQVAVFSYSDDFSALWEFESCQSLRSFSEGDVVIVVDDGWNRRSDLPEANKHLTALDWAVWLTLSRSKADSNGQKSMPTIILLKNDVTKEPSSNDAERFWSIFPENSVPALPWIKMVPLVGRVGELGCLLKLLQIIHGGEHSLLRGDLSMIRQLWQSFFLRPTLPSDNHALSNLLGAGLLTGQFGKSPTRLALMTLMQTLDLLPKAEGNQRARICPKAISDAGTVLHTGLPKMARTKLRFLLVDDDQERHNWAAFVAKGLGLRQSSLGEGGWTGQTGKMQCHLAATDSAAELLKKIRVSRDEHSSLRFDLGHDIDVLFLDLRLFERTSLPVEAKFFIDVIQELRSTNSSIVDATPGDWPKVEEPELHRLEDWCNLAIEGSKSATRNDEQYIDSLTLLPRLVAILNIDLPIILFSSTQRRRVTELLRPYGNIITTFSKPTLQLGNSERLVEETFANFERATLAALELVRGKRIRRLLIDEEFPVYWRGHVEKPIEEKADQPWSVQLLIDESGEKKLTVGGFLAVYPPGVSPSTVNDEIYRQFPRIRNQNKKSRRKTLPSVLWKVIEIVQSHGVLVIPISLSGKRREGATQHSGWHTSSFFQDEMVEDNLHRELMRCLIELGLYVFARQILPESATVEFFFHAPTRALPVTDSEAKALDGVWGIRSSQGLAKHLDHNSARSLLEEVFREYRQSAFNPQPVQARAYGLNTRKDTEVAQVHALHYLADCWVSDNSGSDLKPLREIEIKGNYGPAMSRLLQAHRHLVHGKIGQAIAIGTLAASDVNGTERMPAVNSIVVALQDAARLMTGPECLVLAAALRKMESEVASPILVGTVTSVEAGGDSIQVESGGRNFRATSGDLKCYLSVGDSVQFVPQRGNRIGTFVAKEVRSAAQSSTEEPISRFHETQS